MVAAQELNARSGLSQAVYGCVTMGSEWKFLKLVDRTLEIDQHMYFINKVPLILAALRSAF
jgi:hypothetical protein